jgi:D-alanyl-D-alanine carboxypeptidase
MKWPLRSVTKSYTVTLLLQLVDDGELSLDDTIDEYVDGVTDGDEITLRMLANMTSGNADYTDEAFLEAYSDDPDRLFTLQDLNGFALGEPAQFAPGEEAVYTNANTNLLGAVVETVTGEPFAEVLDERILTPLDLSDTDYVLDVDAWSTPHPTGYVPTEGDVEATPQNFSIFGPAGSMVSSLDDARAWGEALATGALLEPETQADRLDGEPLQEGPPYDIYALGIGETNGWWGHNGEGLGFTAAVFHHPETGATIAAFMNLSNEASGAHAADQFFRRAARDLERS